MCFYSFHFLQAWSELKLLVEFPVMASHLFSKCNYWQVFDWPLPLATLKISAVCLFFYLLVLLLLLSALVWVQCLLWSSFCHLASTTWLSAGDPASEKRRIKKGGGGLMYHFATCLHSVCSGDSGSFFHSLLNLNRSCVSVCSSSSKMLKPLTFINYYNTYSDACAWSRVHVQLAKLICTCLKISQVQCWGLAKLCAVEMLTPA